MQRCFRTSTTTAAVKRSSFPAAAGGYKETRNAAGDFVIILASLLTLKKLRSRHIRLKTGVVLASAFFWAFVAGCDGETVKPSVSKFAVQASPEGAYEATFYAYERGGDSGFLHGTVSSAAYVGVRRRDEPFAPEKGQVFAMRHGSRLRLTWKSERHLHIDYTSSAAVEMKQGKLGPVSSKTEKQCSLFADRFGSDARFSYIALAACAHPWGGRRRLLFSPN